MGCGASNRRCAELEHQVATLQRHHRGEQMLQQRVIQLEGDLLRARHQLQESEQQLQAERQQHATTEKDLKVRLEQCEGQLHALQKQQQQQGREEEATQTSLPQVRQYSNDLAPAHCRVSISAPHSRKSQLARDQQHAQGSTKEGFTTLMRSCMRGDLGTVRLLLAEGANTEARDPEGWTPLFYAAMQGHVEVVRELLIAGADAEARNKHGATALLMAMRNGRTDVVRVLQTWNEVESGRRASAGMIIS